MKISIRNAGVTLNGNTILENINFDICDGEHVAIVGRNGAGKTTFLNALIDPELFEEGIDDEKFSITRIGSYSLGYLNQIDFDDESRTLLDEVVKAYQPLIEMENRLNNLVEKMQTDNSPELIKTYTDLEHNFKMNNGYAYKKEYEVMISKFGFSEADKSKPIKDFSGGERTKICFMKLLLSKPDLLILDEPTNHLDVQTIEWLETYLKNYSGALILVSHDRMFLNNVVTKIYEIEYGKMISYSGNYDFYEKEKEVRYNKLLKDYIFQQKEINRLKAIYERFRNKPTKASMAISRLRQIERMDIIEKPNEEDRKVFRTNLSEIELSSKKVIRLKDLEFGYNGVPLNKISLDIKRGDKIGIIGANGIGKSTLLKTICGVIEPVSGSLEYGLHVKPGYFDQSLAMIDRNNTVLREFRDHLPSLTEVECRRALGSFLFKGDDVHKSLNVLSGGEKVRLELCKILYDKPNLLVLDEPTNHMDILGKEHLENILDEYEGTIVFVSHDRYFVRKIAKSLLVFEDNEIKFYPYGYDEYIKERTGREVIAQKEIKSKVEVVKQVELPKFNFKETKKELNKVENEIIKIEVKIDELTSELYNEEVYNDFNKSNALNEKIKKYKEELSVLNIKWEELTDILMES